MSTSLKLAVKKTLAYSRFFGLPLSEDSLFRWLITSSPVSKEKLKPFCKNLASKDKKIIKTRVNISKQKLQKTKPIVGLLSLLPSIKLICATGSLAVDNAHPLDDLDLMLVVSPNTLWLTRPFVFLILKFLRLRRPSFLPEHRSLSVNNKICDNLWLDETALVIPKRKRTLYIAHEVLQVKPLFDKDNTYAKFILSNSWTKKYLANAYKLISTNLSKPEKRFSKQNGGVIHFLNKLAFSLQYQYMRSKITKETITLHAAFFHPHDLSKVIRQRVDAKII